jgi:hypothetical protein
MTKNQSLPSIDMNGKYPVRSLYTTVLGRQANLKESSKSKELAEMRLQVLVVVITSDACESKKETIRLRE